MGDKKLSDKDKPGKIPGDAMQSREDDDESPNIEDEVVKLDPPAGAREPESMGEVVAGWILRRRNPHNCFARVFRHPRSIGQADQRSAAGDSL